MGNAVFSDNERIDSYRHIEFMGPKQLFDFMTVTEDDSVLNTQRSNDDQVTCSSDDPEGLGNSEEAKARANKRFKRTKPKPVRSKGLTKGEKMIKHIYNHFRGDQFGIDCNMNKLSNFPSRRSVSSNSL